METDPNYKTRRDTPLGITHRPARVNTRLFLVILRRTPYKRGMVCRDADAPESDSNPRKL